MAEGNDPQAAWLQGLPEEQRAKVVGSIKAMVPVIVHDLMPTIVEEVTKVIGYTGEVSGLVQLLAAKSNDPKEEVLRKALTLYGLAIDAREKGNRMAILTPDDVIVREIEGFGPVERASPVPAFVR
jgi:hypothetical protein